MRRICLDRRERLPVTDLLPSERSSAIWVTKLHTTRLGSGESSLGTLADQSCLKFGNRGHLRQ
jgi:hypothetical protein